ncbi:MAG: FprA family A-type flavoprotein [Clostridia bacterium]|nr:FprA family A-type flavoprotein [Clostridia bacterium]
MTVSNSVRYIGVSEGSGRLFENQYEIPKGMSYNSYVILDEKIAVMDSVDAEFGGEWLENIERVLGTRSPDYLVVLHMEPDHSANVLAFAKKYPEAKIVSSQKSFAMMTGFFADDFADRRIVVGDGATLPLGGRTLTFVAAPMVHWPEVMVAYDDGDKILFSADAFGKFGKADTDGQWEDEARRYYFGIVGKYGKQVESLLSKLAGLDVGIICPLHGPVLTENLDYYISLYKKWAAYEPERRGVLIAYASVYGNTARAASTLRDYIAESGEEVKLFDLSARDSSAALADAFKYSHLVLASATYNAGLFPPMRNFILDLLERNYKNRTVALIENGSWAPSANGKMQKMLEEASGVSIHPIRVTVRSALNSESLGALKTLSKELFKN